MFFAPVIRSRAMVPAMRSFDRDFERFVNEAFYAPATAGVNVQTSENGWTITLDVPGVSRDDLSISVDQQYVRIESKPEATRQYKAAYEVPGELDVDASEAKLDNGVLTLTLVKKAPEATGRQIAIR